MDVFGVIIPDQPLTNIDIQGYINILKIPYFRGVFMRDELPKEPHEIECGIVNFNTSSEPGSHWVCYHKHHKNRIYFDSYGQVILAEVINYLKTEQERGKAVIQRNTDIVQPVNTNICGHLCLFVLKGLTQWSFQNVINRLTRVGCGIKWTNTLADELHRPIRKKVSQKVCVCKRN